MRRRKSPSEAQNPNTLEAIATASRTDSDTVLFALRRLGQTGTGKLSPATRLEPLFATTLTEHIRSYNTPSPQEIPEVV